MKRSDNISKIAGALAVFQGAITNPKNAKVNQFFKSKYAPLDEVLRTVRPFLACNGLAVFQDVASVPMRDEGQYIKVTTLLTHVSGEWIESSPLFLPIISNKGVSPAQAAGISITYARRYTIQAVLGISSEEDQDGNSPDQQRTTKKAPPVQAPAKMPARPASTFKPKAPEALKPDPVRDQLLALALKTTKTKGRQEWNAIIKACLGSIKQLDQMDEKEKQIVLDCFSGDRA